MGIRKAIACLRRELNDLDRMIASIEDRMVASHEKGHRTGTSPKKTRDLIARLNPPAFPEPEFGLWQQ
jgi:hypothetical protein